MDPYGIFGAKYNQDLSETVAYNNPLFPVYVESAILSIYPDYRYISHWHEDLEFFVLRKGEITYNVNGELVDLPEESGIFVNSRQMHYGFSADHRECEYNCILFSPKLFSGNDWFYHSRIQPVTENPLYPYVVLTREGWKADILKRLDELYDVFKTPEPSETLYFSAYEIILSIMKTFYMHLNVEAFDPKRESTELTALKAMMDYVEEHFAERITLGELAAAGACCKSKCSAIFKKYLHETPVTHITKLRLRKSLAPLLNTDRGISDIAYEHGFGGASYYCETFQKYYGISPLKYRKKHANNVRRPGSLDLTALKTSQAYRPPHATGKGAASMD